MMVKMTHGFETVVEETAETVQRAVPVTATGSWEASVLIQPDVALHQTRAATARRQLLRAFVRVLSLATADVLAASFALIVVRQLVAIVARVVGGAVLPVSSIAEFCASVLLALLLTANYSRSNPGHTTINLLVGSALGALVVCWSTLWVNPTIPAISAAALLAFVTACSLFIARGALTALTFWLLPMERRLIPAVVLGAHSSLDLTLDATSGYRAASSIVLDGRQSESRMQDLARLLRRGRAEAVIVLGDVPGVVFARLLEIGLRAGCEVLCSPPGSDVAGVRPAFARRGPYNLIQVGPPSLRGQQIVAKRCVDLIGAGLALVCTAPLAILVALAIQLDSPGPIFFRQWRVGIGGSRFRMLKFRTMRQGADEEKSTLTHLNSTGDLRSFKIENDPRITSVGRFLRAWSLDELPQFLNVIMGQMSLVGPRPVPEADFVDYEDHHFRRLGAKPGISGLWQVSGRSSVMGFEERVRMDTEYIDHWSLWLDFRILLNTLPAVLRRTGAY